MTIVVLLILAGVSIQLLLDDNGIIAKSKEAKLNTRISERNKPNKSGFRRNITKVKKSKISNR